MSLAIFKFNSTELEFHRKPDIFKRGENYFSIWENKINAESDADAIKNFLESKVSNVNTYQSYCKEIERFLLWLEFSNINLAGFTPDDCKDYYDFLREPRPFSYWVNSSERKFLSNGGLNPQWKPFKKAYISHSSAMKSIRVVRSMFSFFHNGNYVFKNPVTKNLFKADSHRKIEKTYGYKALRPELVSFICKTLELKAESKSSIRGSFKNKRSSAIFYILSNFGITISELATLNTKDLISSKSEFFLKIKGQKQRLIPISLMQYNKVNEYKEYLYRYFVYLGTDNISFVPKRESQRAVSIRQIANIIKMVFDDISKLILLNQSLYKNTDLKNYFEEDIKKCENATAQWLRHTYGMNSQLSFEISPIQLLTNLGLSKTTPVILYNLNVAYLKEFVSSEISQEISFIYKKMIKKSFN